MQPKFEDVNIVNRRWRTSITNRTTPTHLHPHFNNSQDTLYQKGQARGEGRGGDECTYIHISPHELLQGLQMIREGKDMQGSRPTMNFWDQSPFRLFASASLPIVDQFLCVLQLHRQATCSVCLFPPASAQHVWSPCTWVFIWTFQQQTTSKQSWIL